jgi:serine/threonine protein kinase
MSKLYGNRWKIVDAPALGQGGQSDVFRAIDVNGGLTGEFALKRVKNPKRHDRFRNEVEAVKRLSHPNIVTLIDHSALTEADIAEEKQFLVMPIAKDGDLSRAERLSFYKESIESVLQVAKQIASALAAAHAANIIHRDVKPQNILFTGNGHEIWITDFGICLLREAPRNTPADEVVGPRAFMAPELEEGGKLDVTPAADVYSLGKVIYFMYSGGVILPRERLHEDAYARILDTGERPRLLGSLLRQMICPIESRIQSMKEVLQRLQQIAEWEQNARLLPMDPHALLSIERLQRQALDTVRVADENASAREQERQTLESVKTTFTDWLRAELEKAAAAVTNGGVLKCLVREVTFPGNQDWRAAYAHNRMHSPIAGLEIQFSQPGDAREHILQVRLCQDAGPLVTVSISLGPQKVPTPQTIPVRDADLAMIPYYRNTMPNRPPKASGVMGFLAQRALIGSVRGGLQQGQPVRGRRGPAMVQYRVQPITLSFSSDVNQHIKFKASEWPSKADVLREALSQAISSFFAYVESGAQNISQ